MPPNSRIHALLGARILNFTKLSSNKQEKRGCRISKYFCWAAALLSAQNGIEISYGSDAIL